MSDGFAWMDTTDPILDVPVPDAGTLNDVPVHLYAIVAALAAATGVSRLTAAQRDALKPANKPVGRMIHNVSAKRFEWWDGAAWADVAGDVSAYVRRAGSVMTGPLLLAGDPVEELAAAPKRWVEGRVGVGFLPLAGGTMRGAINLAGAPTKDLHAATRAYVGQVARNAVPDSAVLSGVVQPVLWNTQSSGIGLKPTVVAPGDMPITVDDRGSVVFTGGGVFRIDLQATTEATGAGDVMHRAQIGRTNGLDITHVDRCSLGAFGAVQPVTQWLSIVCDVVAGDKWRIGVWLQSASGSGRGWARLDWARVTRLTAAAAAEEG